MSTSPRHVRFNVGPAFPRTRSDDDDFDDLPAEPRSVRVSLPENIPPELSRTVLEEQRIQALIMMHTLVLRLGQMSISELVSLTQSEGFEIIRFAQGLAERAEKELSAKYRKWFDLLSERSTQGGLRSLLEVQYGGTATFEDLLATAPNFPIMPPQKQGLIRQIVTKMFGLEG